MGSRRLTATQEQLSEVTHEETVKKLMANKTFKKEFDAILGEFEQYHDPDDEYNTYYINSNRREERMNAVCKAFNITKIKGSLKEMLAEIVAMNSTNPNTAKYLSGWKREETLTGLCREKNITDLDLPAPEMDEESDKSDASDYVEPPAKVERANSIYDCWSDERRRLGEPKSTCDCSACNKSLRRN